MDYFSGKLTLNDEDVERAINYFISRDLPRTTPIVEPVGYALIHAVFSINARGGTGGRAVDSFVEFLGENGRGESIADVHRVLGDKTPEFSADSIFRNRQRTSPHKHAILKSDAVLRMANALVERQIQEVDIRSDSAKLNVVVPDIMKIPGQRSGISFSLFLMRSGNFNHVKPDRRVQKFVRQLLGRPVSPHLAARLVKTAALRMSSMNSFEWVTPYHLDQVAFVGGERTIGTIGDK